MTRDEIIKQLDSLRANSVSFIDGINHIWSNDVTVLSAVIDVIRNMSDKDFNKYFKEHLNVILTKE